MNRFAWDACSYEVWVHRYGTSDTAAANIVLDAQHALRRVLDFVGKLPGKVVPTCLIRRWNSGEIVTAFAVGDFVIEQLVEHPLSEFEQLPGAFTLVARAT